MKKKCDKKKEDAKKRPRVVHGLRPVPNFLRS